METCWWIDPATYITMHVVSEIHFFSIFKIKSLRDFSKSKAMASQFLGNSSEIILVSGLSTNDIKYADIKMDTFQT